MLSFPRSLSSTTIGERESSNYKQLKRLHNYAFGHCEEQSDAAIYYDYMELQIASLRSQ